MATLFFVMPATSGLTLNAQVYLQLNFFPYQTVLNNGAVLNIFLIIYYIFLIIHHLNLKSSLVPLILRILIYLAHDLSYISEQCQNNCLNIDNVQTVDCKYYKFPDFCKLIHDNGPFSFSTFYLNIPSLSLHFDDLTSLLARCSYHFDILVITETCFLKDN